MESALIISVLSAVASRMAISVLPTHVGPRRIMTVFTAFALGYMFFVIFLP